MRERGQKFIFELIRSLRGFREFMLPGCREQELFVHRHHLASEQRGLCRIGHLDYDTRRAFVCAEYCPHRIRPVNGWRIAVPLID